jgi:hypothetical protein
MKDIAAKCLMNIHQKNEKFRSKHCTDGNTLCLNKYYSDRMFTGLDSYLKENRFHPKIKKIMSTASNISLAHECLKKSFLETQQKSQWIKIEGLIRNDLGRGGRFAIIRALQKIGWKIHYWNPYNKASDLADQDRLELGQPLTSEQRCKSNIKMVTIDGISSCPKHSIGHHGQGLKLALSEKIYFENSFEDYEEYSKYKEKAYAIYSYHKRKADGKATSVKQVLEEISRKRHFPFLQLDNVEEMVGFGEGTPAMLDNESFWVGAANGGYHTFSGLESNIFEFQNEKRLVSKSSNFRIVPFKPLENMGNYLSGVIAIAP